MPTNEVPKTKEYIYVRVCAQDLIGKAVERDGSAPLEVARDAAWLEAVADPVACDGLSAVAPSAAARLHVARDVLAHFRFELRLRATQIWA